MNKTFLAAYKVSSQVENLPDMSLLNKIDLYANGFSHLMSTHGGTTFNNGLYRLHAVQDILKWTKTIEEEFTTYKDRAICFGYDWLGRHFALDKTE